MFVYYMERMYVYYMERMYTGVRIRILHHLSGPHTVLFAEVRRGDPAGLQDLLHGSGEDKSVWFLPYSGVVADKAALAVTMVAEIGWERLCLSRSMVLMIDGPFVSLSSLIDDAKCFDLVRQHRWPDGVRYPTYGSAAVARQIPSALFIRCPCTSHTVQQPVDVERGTLPDVRPMGSLNKEPRKMRKNRSGGARSVLRHRRSPVR
jgi:hypothetical protein